MDYLAIAIGGANITPPSSVPTGGLRYLEDLAKNFMMVFLFVGVCLMLIYVTWGGVQWIMSGGDKQKLAAASAKVRIAIIGFIMLLISYALIAAVGFLFNVDLLRLV